MSFLEQDEKFEEIKNEYEEGYVRKGIFTPEEMMEKGVVTDYKIIKSISKHISIPNNYVVCRDGIYVKKYKKNGEKIVKKICNTLVIPVNLVKYVDKEDLDIKIAFYQLDELEYFVIERRELMDKNRIYNLNKFGITINYSNANDMIDYFTDVLEENKKMEIINVSNKIGWFEEKTGYIPYKNNEVLFATNKGFENMMDGYEVVGNIEEWIKEIQPYLDNIYFRFCLATGFSGPLIDIVNCRNPIVNLWYGSRAGKTAMTQAVLSIYGNPRKLEKTWNGTIVGIEQVLSYSTKDNILVLDEGGLAPKELEKYIFMIASGTGKIRGNIDGGIKKICKFKCSMISTSEKPLQNENAITGVNSRIISLYGKPIEDEVKAQELYKIKNYGVAGSIFINKLIEENLDTNYKEIKNKYEEISNKLRIEFPSSVGSYIQSIAVIILADILMNKYFFKDSEESSLELGFKILEQLEQEKDIDVTERAFELIKDEILANYRFIDNIEMIKDKDLSIGRDDTEKIVQNTRWGFKEGEMYYIFSSRVKQTLLKNGFSYKKSLKEFAERGYIKTQGNNNTVQKKYKNKNVRMVAFYFKDENEITEEEKEEFIKNNGKIFDVEKLKPRELENFK